MVDKPKHQDPEYTFHDSAQPFAAFVQRLPSNELADILPVSPHVVLGTMFESSRRTMPPRPCVVYPRPEYAAVKQLL